MGDPCWSSLCLKDCSPWNAPMLEQFMKNCSLWEGPTLEKFMEDCLPWEGPHAGAGGCPKEAGTPWEAHTGAGSWQDLWPHGKRSPHWSRFAGGTCDAMGDPCWSSLCLKDCSLGKGPTLEQGTSEESSP